MNRITATAAITLAMFSLNAQADTYMLGTVQYRNDKPQVEQTEDTRACNQEAMKAPGSSGAQTAGIVGGVVGGAVGGAIGGLIGAGMEQDHRRELFKACMTQKGYVVFPAADEDRFTRIQLPDGFEKRKLSIPLLAGGWELSAANKKLDVHFLAQAIDKKYIPNLKTYAQGKRDRQLPNIAYGKASDVTDFNFSNYKGYTYAILGQFQSLKMKFQTYYLFVNNQVVVVQITQQEALSPEDSLSVQNGVLNAVIDALQPESRQ